jgi:hypothetical protein
VTRLERVVSMTKAWCHWKRKEHEFSPGTDVEMVSDLEFLAEEAQRLEFLHNMDHALADKRQAEVEKLELELRRLKRVAWAARRVRDGYPPEHRGTYYEDLCAALSEVQE